MRRRAFISLLGGAAVAWPLPHSGTGPRLSDRQLASVACRCATALASVAELHTLGFLDGQNLTVDRRGYGLPVERFAEVVQDHVKAHADVILCGGEAAARAAQEATQTIPLVVLVDDAIRAGFVHSLAVDARPKYQPKR